MLRLLLSIVAITNAVFALGQIDTTSITINFEEAKARMFKENLALLASYYEVSASEAQLAQAKLWNNPNFIWNQDLYSVEQNRYFNVKNQRLVQVEQTFSMAGKHTNSVRLSRLGVELSKYQLEDVLRSLLFELGNVYFSLNAAQQLQQLYLQTLGRYDQLIKSADEKFKVGAMASNEVLRLRSEQIAIRAQSTENNNEVLDLMSQLKILLNLESHVTINTFDEVPSNGVVKPLYILIDSALSSRPDYKLQQVQIRYEEQNLRLQKSLSVPDATFGYQPHDKGSNYVRPYEGLTFEFNLPLFNRNQGNIKLAKTRIIQSEIRSQLAENTLRNEVQKSYEQLINTRRGFEDFSEEFIRQTEELNTNANLNYGKKNINLLEFIDLQRIYIQNKTQYIELKNAYLKSINQMNFAVGQSITN
jgi:outer membrane protein, heavy metal efflux system